MYRKDIQESYQLDRLAPRIEVAIQTSNISTTCVSSGRSEQSEAVVSISHNDLTTTIPP